MHAATTCTSTVGGAEIRDREYPKIIFNTTLCGSKARSAAPVVVWIAINPLKPDSVEAWRRACAGSLGPLHLLCLTRTGHTAFERGHVMYSLRPGRGRLPGFSRYRCSK
jgi:hypothetical protein